MTEANGSAAPEAPAQIRMQVLAQYIRDLSFENVVAQKGLTSGEVQPDVTVQVSLDARKRPQPNQYEVINKFRVTSRNKATGDSLFLMELEYAGIFLVEGVPDDQIHPFLLIECPRMLFPFVRRIISDVTRDGGFPALNVDTVDYMALYRQELARRAEPQKAPATTVRTSEAKARAGLLRVCSAVFRSRCARSPWLRINQMPKTAVPTTIASVIQRPSQAPTVTKSEISIKGSPRIRANSHISSVLFPGQAVDLSRSVPYIRQEVAG